jgi:hypothetical protein
MDYSLTEEKLTTTLTKKLKNYYVTPEMFGATGNGGTDDSVAIQAAIDYVNSQGGGVVQFGDKTYICQGIIPKNNVTLKGTPRARMKLPLSPTNHMIYYESDSVLTNFNLINIELDGRNQTVYDLVHIEKISSDIVYVWDKSIIDTCVIHYGNVGVYCTVPGNVKIVNSVIEGNDIGVKQGYEHFHIINTTLWANRIGADIYKANHFTWVDVTFAHNTECGVNTDLSFESCLTACNFIDNVVHFNGSVYGYRFIGCRMIDAQKGIYGARWNNIFDGCYFSNLSDIALSLINSDCSANVISNNIFSRNGKDIELSGSDNLIQANQFRGTKKCAIELKGDSASGIQILNNIALNCSEIGLNAYAVINITAPYLTAIAVNGNMIRNDGSGKASYAINMNMTPTGLFDILIANNVSRNMKTAGYRLRDSGNITKVNNIGTVETF